MTKFRSIAGQMTQAHEQAVRECADAELRGDAAGALRRHRTVPMFARSTHGDRLALLSDLGRDAPSWLISRWLTVQARRPNWTGGDERALRSVLSWVVPLVHPHGVAVERIGCEHPQQVMAWFNERDWVVRQVDLYDRGGLLRFVRGHACAPLLERAESVQAWCAAPMGAYRLEAAGEVVDLTTRTSIEILDRGASEWLPEGQHVLGRVVPSGSGPMFEWCPLPVDRWTAVAVASDPRGWLRVVSSRASDGRLPVGFSYQPEFAFTSDQPLYSWLSLLGRPVDSRPQSPDDARRALEEVLRLAASDPAGLLGRRHMVGGLLLEPDLTERHLARYATPVHAPAWDVLAGAVPEPARRRCVQTALLSRAASQSTGGSEPLAG